MDIKIFNHTQNNEVVVRYVANNGTHQINMQTLVEKWNLLAMTHK